MSKKKSADLSSVLVATKGSASPVSNTLSTKPYPMSYASSGTSNVPLNFRVSSELRRRFRMFAAEKDLKLNELFRLAFDEYEENHKSEWKV